MSWSGQNAAGLVFSEASAFTRNCDCESLEHLMVAYGNAGEMEKATDVFHMLQNQCQDYEEIDSNEEDSRAKRITSYLNMMDEMVERQMEKLRTSVFEKGSEICKYFEMLPESPLRSLYTKMQDTLDPEERARLQETLRRKITPGAIDVNIMTKLDRDRMSKGQILPPVFSDAMSALRGYANSRVKSSLVLSAGMNRRLFMPNQNMPA